jgi:hypothetical protein
MNKVFKDKDDTSSMVNGNTILLAFEGWIKYIEGFIKGLQTTEKVNSTAVLDCVGEVLEYMVTLKSNITRLLIYCETVLQENEMLKEQLQAQVKPDITEIDEEENDEL